MKQRIHLLHRTITVWTFLVLGGLGIAICTPSFVSGDNAIAIQMRSSAAVGKNTVQLKDVAQITHTDAQTKDRIGRIKVAEAPLPGRSRWVTARQVQMGLARAGIESSDYRIQKNGPTRVSRHAATVSSRRIRDAVEGHILANAPWDADQMKIRQIAYSQDVTVAQGQLSLRVQSPKHIDWLGSIPFTVLITVDGTIAKKVTVPATIEVWSDVVVLAKPLGKYQTIEAHHTRIEKMNLARVPSNAVLNIDQAIGSRTNRNIVANSILRNDQIELPPVVKRGDVVQVVAESKRMKISIQAMARENGAVGKVIRVQNLRSKKTIYAQVVDSQTVQVDF